MVERALGVEYEETVVGFERLSDLDHAVCVGVDWFGQGDRDDVVAESGVQRGDRLQASEVDTIGSMGAVDLDDVIAEAGPDGDAADVTAVVIDAWFVGCLVRAKGDRAIGETNDVDLGVGVRVCHRWQATRLCWPEDEFACSRRHRWIREQRSVGLVGDQHVGVVIGRCFVADHERLITSAAPDVQQAVNVVECAGEERWRFAEFDTHISVVRDVDAVVAVAQVQIGRCRGALDVCDVVAIAEHEVQCLDAVVTNAGQPILVQMDRAIEVVCNVCGFKH